MPITRQSSDLTNDRRRNSFDFASAIPSLHQQSLGYLRVLISSFQKSQRRSDVFGDHAALALLDEEARPGPLI
jgi:hypothetical protein